MRYTVPGRPQVLDSKRRDVRVVEGARLESVCRGNSTVGSNPTLSVPSFSQNQSVFRRFPKSTILFPLSVFGCVVLFEFRTKRHGAQSRVTFQRVIAGALNAREPGGAAGRRLRAARDEVGSNTVRKTSASMATLESKCT